VVWVVGLEGGGGLGCGSVRCVRFFLCVCVWGGTVSLVCGAGCSWGWGLSSFVVCVGCVVGFGGVLWGVVGWGLRI